MCQQPPSWDVIGIGANSVDFVNILPAWPEPTGPRSKMRLRGRLVSCGGQTATTMAACSGFGLRAKYVGAVGCDQNGRLIEEELRRRSVDISEVVVGQVPNGCAVILIEEHCGERIVLWERDDRLRLPTERLVPATVAGARLIHVDDGDTATAVEAARLGRAAGIPVTSDIDKTLDLTPALIEAVTYPIFAEHVPAGLTGTADLEQALRQLRNRYPQVLTVTLGASGAVALDGDTIVHEPAFAVDVVDTTGAGDIFRAGFIYATLQGMDVRATLRFANAAAAASCRVRGAMAGAPPLADVQALLATGSRLGSGRR